MADWRMLAVKMRLNDTHLIFAGKADVIAKSALYEGVKRHRESVKRGETGKRLRVGSSL
jgi:hypothetical protein